MYGYFKLTSNQHNGMIIRVNEENHHEEYFNTETEKWTKIGIMLNYFFPESDTYDMYEELTEKEVKKIIISNNKEHF